MSEVLTLKQVRIDGGTQMRVELDQDVVADYAQTIRGGTDFPPVVVFFDGASYWLADGFHRYHGYRSAGALEIPADIHTGTQKDAILFSVGANAAHGLRRTNADKRKAVETLLRDEVWGAWSDSRIARAAGVSDKTVAAIRRELSSEIPKMERTVERNGTTYQQNTANIGKSEREEEREAKRAEEASRLANREAMVAQLPSDVRDRLVAADEAKSASADRSTASLPSADRIAELEAAVEALERDQATDRARIAELVRLEAIEADYKAGGFEAVIAAERAATETWKAKYHAENREKVAALKEAKFWRKRAIELGHSSDTSATADVEIVASRRTQ